MGLVGNATAHRLGDFS